MTGTKKIPKIIKSSYELHNKEERRLIKDLYLAETQAAHDEENTQKTLHLNTKKLTKQRETLPILVDYYKNQLATTNPASFRFLRGEQKSKLRKQLVFTFFVLYAQYQLDATEGRNYTLKAHQEALELCQRQIEDLDNSSQYDDEIPDNFVKDLEANISWANKCMKFLGLTIVARWFVEKWQQFSDSKTGALKEWMTEINGMRLYWVWGGGMLTSLLEMLPEDFYNKSQTKEGLAAPAPITGYMSWLLYYTRFGIHLFLLLKHTLGPWMIESEESKTPMWERFITQWNQRKFALLNDSIWGFANMLCFFWLNGGGNLGYIGNVATALLLIMDLALTTWRFFEESTKHNAAMLAYERDKIALLKKILAAGKLHDNSGKMELWELELESGLTENLKEQILGFSQTMDDPELVDLRAQIIRLDKMQSKAEFDWKYKRYALVNDWVYALGLMMAFVVMCSFLFPPAAIVPATAMILGVAGAALCFILTVACAAISGGLEITKSLRSSKQAKTECQTLLNAFINENDENIKKQLYLEMKGVMATSDYNQRMARIQAIKLVRSVLIDAFLPAVIFISLMFMPLGIGLAVMAAGLALAVISNIIIKRFEPKPELLPKFNQHAYEAFAENPELAHFDKKADKGGFFDKNTSEKLPDDYDSKDRDFPLPNSLESF